MSSFRVLVTGGAGYVGSFTVRALQEAGYDVVVYDNLQQGHRAAVCAPLVVGELIDREAVFACFRRWRFDAVVHLAAYTSVRESVENPKKYVVHNVGGSIVLLDACLAHDVPYVVFSSTSEVYGEARYLPLDEDHPTEPTNPYGTTKLDGSMGEDHRPEEHLIPNAIRGALGLQPFRLTSAPVETPDGTTIRDYVHVLDLADAHVRALEALRRGHPTDVINLGSGVGYSTRQIVELVQELTGVRFPIERGEPRPGEPPVKYASFAKAERVLGWRPRYGIEEIIASAVRWHTRFPHGYPD